MNAANGIRSPIPAGRQLFVRVVKQVGTAGYRFHDNRHTAATRLLRATGDLRATQLMLGHSRPETTAKYWRMPPPTIWPIA